ncbi:hypothetical protein L915_03588 [Phytophthora nicotianae]|uniref:Uncharacterized protein n=1 Tax=Phytophthora nicotianae TaxID=4792 RepID=W2HD45_PHYNI|nr:hypothetical protein L915_03588 [Phytophthora nicotianae]
MHTVSRARHQRPKSGNLASQCLDSCRQHHKST